MDLWECLVLKGLMDQKDPLDHLDFLVLQDYLDCLVPLPEMLDVMDQWVPLVDQETKDLPEISDQQDLPDLLDPLVSLPLLVHLHHVPVSVLILVYHNVLLAAVIMERSNLKIMLSFIYIFTF
jgi:hypothetical protein